VLIRPSDPSLAVFVCLEPVDFRKQAAALVQVQLDQVRARGFP
jgi:hypothetical protein